MYVKLYQNILNCSRDRASFTFFRIWTSAKPWPMTNSTWQSLWLDLVNINVYATFHQYILFHSVQMIAPFSLFQNLDLGIASTDAKICYLQSLWLDLVNINVYAKLYQNIPNCSRVMGIFRKLIWDGHTNSQTDRDENTNWSWADNPKTKEQELLFLSMAHFLISWSHLWSFIKLSCTVQEL